MQGTLKRAGVALVGLGLLSSAPAPAAGKKTAIFDVTAVHAGTGAQVTITSKVWVTPTQARAEVKHPLDGDQTYLVSSGFFYMLDPKGKRGVKAPLPPEIKKRSDNFSQLVAQFAFDASGPLQMSKKVRTETLSGYPCDVYSKSVSQGDATRSITVWLPQKMEPKFPIKAILTDKLARPGANMDNRVTITLSNIRLNTAISPSTFAVPKGYTLKTAQAGPKPASAAARRK